MHSFTCDSAATRAMSSAWRSVPIFDRHLGTCTSCSAEAGRDRVVRPCPCRRHAGRCRSPGLRDRLLAQASASHGGVIRRKVFRVAALAASLLVGLGLALGLFASRPRLATDALCREERRSGPAARSFPLQQWLASLHAPTQLPYPFDSDPSDFPWEGNCPGEGCPDRGLPGTASRMASTRRCTSSSPTVRSTPAILATPGFRTTSRRWLRDERNRATYVVVYKFSPVGLKPFLATRNPASARNLNPVTVCRFTKKPRGSGPGAYLRAYIFNTRISRGVA